jgi:hypothetical protein
MKHSHKKMIVKPPVTASKFIKMSEFFSQTFNLNERLREALMSPSKESAPFLNISTAIIVGRDSNMELRGLLPSNDKFIKNSSSNDDEDENDSWKMAETCLNGCKKCRKFTTDESFPTINIISLTPSLLTNRSLPNIRSYLSIVYVMPLRNFGAIIRWTANHQYDIRGYKVFVDGAHVSTVHSKSRLSALAEHVNMKIPHHFAVSVIPFAEKIPKTSHRNMHAVYLYKPNEFID